MLRGLIYDVTLRPLTRGWYREVLGRLPEGARLLDVGIGTGGALAGNAKLVRSKQLQVTGIDIDADYVKRALKRIQEAGLDDNVQVRLQSVYDHQGGPYDAVYFSASFMLLPEPERALRHVTTLLKPDGRVFFTQTFNERRSTLLEKAKPLLRKLTTIEFGRVTYEDDFLNTLKDGGLHLEELVTMNANAGHSFRLAVAARHPAAQ
jgi:tRNA A58 N-methylase Trm61